MPRAARDYYIDRLRVIVTALVILHHTAITYGGAGGWFWKEHDTSPALSSLLLTLFCATNQAWFMGFFFLLAGFYTPGSLAKKGYARFLLDRFLRLGLPLLAFIFILGPLTAAIVTYAQGQGFWPTIVFLWQHKRIINGPLWFAQALLIFSLVYCAWSASLRGSLTGPQHNRTVVPAYGWWLLGALATGAAALEIRQFFPVGENIFGLQLGYFAGYIVLFAIGIMAWRHDWLRQLTWRDARPWIVTSVIVWPTLPVAIAFARHHHSDVSFTSGHSWAAILYAFWEPFVAWGIIALWLLVFRQRLNKPSPLWEWMARRAYAVYIIHPPILVGIALSLHRWVAPALLKFGVVGALAVAACWLLSDPLVRLPGLRNII